MAQDLACCWTSSEWNVAFIIEPTARDERDEQGPAGEVSVA